MDQTQIDTPNRSVLEWVARLIAIDTTSHKSNLALIDCLKSFFERHNLTTTVTHNHSGSKANLFATIPGRRSTVGGLILSGHTDVVPVDGQRWETHPFKAEIRDGRLFGRGACDMKGFLGTAIALLPTFIEMKLDESLHFALSFDEELGCLGAPIMIADFLRRGMKPSACIVGEPTEMQPVVAHKATRLLKCSIVGRAAHSSRPHDGVNAIEYAGRLLEFLRTLSNVCRVLGPLESGFDPPYSTVAITQMSGGIAPNVIPEECSFVFDYRSLPCVDGATLKEDMLKFIDDAILPEMRSHFATADVQIEELASVPGLSDKCNCSLATVASALTGSAAIRVSYGTEAGQFEAASIPTLVCGPGSIKQAHKSDEWIELSQLAFCERFLKQVVWKLLGPQH